MVVEKINTGYSAFLPDLPECVTVAGTKEDIESNIKEVIYFHLSKQELKPSSFTCLPIYP